MRMTMRIYILVLTLIAVLLAGCVERRLTIVTKPSEAVVWLNDEEVGVTPVTVNFKWYGDYRVRIEKPGYEIMNTHRELERPLHDRPGIDFFAEIWPGRIVDEFTWEFELEPYRPLSAADLIEQAKAMQERATNELGKTSVELLKDINEQP